jgi:hypothetical protein
VLAADDYGCHAGCGATGTPARSQLKLTLDRHKRCVLVNSTLAMVRLIIGLITVLGTSEGRGTTDVSPSDLPGPVIKAASEYVVGNLGETFFTNYVTFVHGEFKEGSKCISDEIRGGPHFEVVFQIYIPERPWVRVNVCVVVLPDGTVAHGTYYSDVPDCVSNPIECEFPINEEQALTIARNAGFSEDLAPFLCRVQWFPHRSTYAWSVWITLEVRDEYYGSGRLIFIDANTGNVYDDGWTFITE